MEDADGCCVAAGEGSQEFRGRHDGHNDEIELRLIDRCRAERDRLPIGAGAVILRKVGRLFVGGGRGALALAFAAAHWLGRARAVGDARQPACEQAAPTLRQRQDEATSQDQDSRGAAHTVDSRRRVGDTSSGQQPGCWEQPGC